MNILYLVHNTRDAAVERRVRMLMAGGARLIVAGFRRAPEPPEDVAGAPVLDLGRSFDAKLGQRAALTLKSALRLTRFKKEIEGCDLIVARNLETLLLAVRAQQVAGRRIPIVYECLDIHRLMLGSGYASRIMRALERRLLARCSLLIVSSPAFVREYFDGVQHATIRTLLIENKVFDQTDSQTPPAAASLPRPGGPPWRIGWFGMIRCRRSFEILKGVAARLAGRVEVVIRGIPTPAVFPDFERELADAPGLTFGGSYGAGQLADLYSAVHFAWAMDFYEEGQNSSWLLPNRLYEGPAHGAVPVALGSVETGRWLKLRDAGIVVDEPGAVEQILEGMSQEEYVRLFRNLQHLDAHDLHTTEQDCFALVQALSELTPR